MWRLDIRKTCQLFLLTRLTMTLPLCLFIRVAFSYHRGDGYEGVVGDAIVPLPRFDMLVIIRFSRDCYDNHKHYESRGG